MNEAIEVPSPLAVEGENQLPSDAGESVVPSPRGNLGIIRLNSQEWWAAESVEEAVQASARHFGVPAHEVLDELYPPYRLSAEELWASTLFLNGEIVTFMRVLMQRVEDGAVFPHLFGTNE